MGVAGPQQDDGGHRAQHPGRGQRRQPFAADGVRDLVVVLQERDERGRRQVQRRGPAALLLPGVPLPLVQVPPLHRRQDLLRGAAVVRVVGLVVAGQRDARAVVEVVVPQRVQAVAAGLGRAHHPRLLRLVLGDQQAAAAHPPPTARAARSRPPGDRARRRRSAGWRPGATRRSGTPAPSSRRSRCTARGRPPSPGRRS